MSATQISTVEDEFNVDVISCPAPRDPAVQPKKPINRGEQHYVNDSDYTLMKSKIEAVLALSAQSDCRNLVLGAFGCGGFHNPIRDVAEILRNALRGNDWVADGLENVIIAIPPTTPAWPVFLSEFEQDYGATDGPKITIDDAGDLTSDLDFKCACLP